ncbi:DNA polymerase III subunit delta [Chelatococcus reniformis]|uniref:DNA polymerase III subunit delta n=1 Tax=Chelatococcus reniformis TaxID=1494448 RepID=A0A916TY20_9HYPH|nr:DNA polymerase III subunit delta [Chelatococcus reniformis]GGC51561.1 DNA polymerase III subunit delta [Chelatococcus reniformis]
MVAVKPGDIAGILDQKRLKAAVVLVYGPDSGLVAERARRIAENAVDNPGDPFQLVRLDGDGVAADPLKLADEANTIGLFGGRRAIWIKPSSRSLVAALTPVLATRPEDAVVVVEAGDLARSSPVRTLCERSPAALAIPCYADGPRELAGLVDATMRDAGLQIDREAKEQLVALLGGDRLASRNELEKLVLYAHGSTRVTEDDIAAAVGDVSTIAADELVDAVFAGDLPAADQAYAKLRSEGMDPGVVVGFLLRHALALAASRIAIDRGGTPEGAVERMRVHFKRKARVERHLRLWTSPALAKVVQDCGKAVGRARRMPALGAPTAETTIWSIGAAARRAAARLR